MTSELNPTLTGISSQCERLAIESVRRLRGHSYQAFLVGGCVRDRLLGLVPKDFDVNTDASPESLLSLFPSSELIGAHFGVVLVSAKDGAQVEIATFRSEGAYSDGRRPDRVQFESDPALDAQRRDFTINGLMQDPLSGEVLDFVGGREDLKRKLIRAIGDPHLRFDEDHLRMLRAIRFAARLGFDIEADTMRAIQQLAHCISDISAERIRDELLRILTEGHARRGFELLDGSGLLPHILPEVDAFHGVEQPPEFHPEGDVWKHVLTMLDEMGKPTGTLALGVLLHDVGKPATFRLADRIRFDGHAEIGAQMAEGIATRLKLPNDDASQIKSLVANHMKFNDVRRMRISTLKRFLSMPRFTEHLELHRLDCLASNGRTDAYDFVREKLSELKQEELRPAPLLNGDDLRNAGYKPGPAFGRALNAVETAQLEGEVQTREQALSLARSVLDSRLKSLL